MEMLLRYFDQKIKKSRLSEFWYHLVPFGTTKPIGTKIGTHTTFPIRIRYALNCIREGQASETQTVVKKGFKVQTTDSNDLVPNSINLDF